MTKEELLLWDKIRKYEIGSSNTSFSFSDRLARENGWNLKFSLKAILEYKRFIFLICITGEHLTPSDQVDQVWHLHLLYTRDYWEDFCRQTLQKEIHHGPTKGGTSERNKFETLYSNTLERYKLVFQVNPPEAVWPPSKVRFSKINYRRTSVDDYYIVPRHLKGMLKWIFSKS